MDGNGNVSSSQSLSTSPAAKKVEAATGTGEPSSTATSLSTGAGGANNHRTPVSGIATSINNVCVESVTPPAGRGTVSVAPMGEVVIETPATTPTLTPAVATSVSCAVTPSAEQPAASPPECPPPAPLELKTATLTEIASSSIASPVAVDANVPDNAEAVANGGLNGCVKAGAATTSQGVVNGTTARSETVEGAFGGNGSAAAQIPSTSPPSAVPPREQIEVTAATSVGFAGVVECVVDTGVVAAQQVVDSGVDVAAVETAESEVVKGARKKLEDAMEVEGEAEGKQEGVEADVGAEAAGDAAEGSAASDNFDVSFFLSNF